MPRTLLRRLILVMVLLAVVVHFGNVLSSLSRVCCGCRNELAQAREAAQQTQEQLRQVQQQPQLHPHHPHPSQQQHEEREAPRPPPPPPHQGDELRWQRQARLHQVISIRTL